jgi:small conductance mechanosensitive channel
MNQAKYYNYECIFSILMFFLMIFSAASALAAEKEKTHDPPPITTENPTIAIDELGYLLMPLTKDELLVEADGWLKILKEQVEKVSSVQIESLSAEDDAKQKLLESVTKLKEEQIALSDRMNTVLDAYRVKGGKTADYEAYLKAISGVKVDVTDASASYTVIMGWLLSKEGGLRWAKNISLFLVIVFIAWILAKIISRAVKKAVTRVQGASELLKDFMVKLTRQIIFLIGFIVALSMLEINIGPLLAAIGAAGFVIGFALQGTLSNFAAGIMILFYRPYDIGDMVEVGDTFGKVDNMTIVSTTLRTPDNQKVIVPNNMIWGDVITNVTGTATRRVDLVFGIGYDDDIPKAQSLLEEILSAHELVLKHPEPVVKVHELADSSVNFVARPWVNTGDYWDVYWDITRTVKERFDAAGISIPYPQQDVHMHQVPAAAS